MPRIIVGARGRRSLTEVEKRKYDYSYPQELDLTPGSELHNRIVDNVLELAGMSYDTINSQFSRWRKIDDVLTAYIRLDEEEEDIKYADSRKPTSIVFPYSYAILDALLTYMVMAFVRDPIFKYEGVAGKDYAGAVLLEATIAQHCRRSKVALSLHTLFRDSFVYGRGYAIPSWVIKHGRRSTISNTESMVAGVAMDMPRRTREDTVLFEGNTLYNVNPYLALPDPNVGAANVQDGEFFGWLETTNYMSLLSDELSDENMFNVQYVKHVSNTISQFLSAEAMTVNSERDSFRETFSSLTTPVDVLAMYIKLIPSEWGLGNGEYPENWLFRIAADSVLIEATPLDYDHGLLPIVAAAPDDDGRSPTPISRLETLYGLQEVGDWLFNSHMANVRKSINDMLIVDPTMVNMKDLRDPGPGKLVRLRRPAWGRGVGDVVMQLKVDDITRGNIADTGFIQQSMQIASATDQSMMGSLRMGGPERLTKGEFQGTRGAAMNRLERVAMVIGLQALQDLGYFFASHTQQFMTETTYVKIVEGLEEDLAKELAIEKDKVRVSYSDILVDYDIIVRDGSIPGGNFSEGWLQLYKTISENPVLMQQFDMVRIFMHIARNLGAKNVADFQNKMKAMANPPVLPDETVAAEAQAGNMIPFGR